MLLLSANIGATGVAIASAALTLTGYAPTPKTPVIATPAKATATFQGYAPGVFLPSAGMPAGPMLLFGLNLQPAAGVNPLVGSITSTGYVPTLSSPSGIETDGDDDLPGFPALYSQVATMDATGLRILPGDQTRFPARITATFTGYVPTLVSTSGTLPGRGTLTSTGYVPETKYSRVFPAVGTATFQGYAPGKIFLEQQEIQVDEGTGTFTGYAPSTTVLISGTVGTGTFLGYAPVLRLSVVLSKGTGVFVGYAPTLAQTAHQVATPGTGIGNFTGYAFDFAYDQQTRNPAVGTSSFTGYAPSTTRLSDVGKYSGAFTGYAPTLVDVTQPIISPAIYAGAFTGYIPVLTDNLVQSVGSGVFTGYTPTVAQSEQQEIEYEASAVPQGTFTGYAPTIAGYLNIAEGLAIFAGFAPTLDEGIFVPAGELRATSDDFGFDEKSLSSAGLATFTGYAPSVVAEGFLTEGGGGLNSRRATMDGAGVQLLYGTGNLTCRATFTAEIVQTLLGDGVLDGGYATINAQGRKGNGDLIPEPTIMIGIGQVLTGATVLEVIAMTVTSKAITMKVKAKSMTFTITTNIEF